LTDHYGAGIGTWLEGADRLLSRVGDRWKVDLIGFHDEGWTSVVAEGRAPGGRTVVLKAVPESDRFHRELVALRHWPNGVACQLLDWDDTTQVLLLDAVAGRIGGAARPVDHQERVARRLAALHARRASSETDLPSLADYYRKRVMPRIRARAMRFGAEVGAARVSRVLTVAQMLCESIGPASVLHADLYAENALFDDAGKPVFIDPYPMVGPPAFDWGFWCVYYRPAAGFAERLGLSQRHAVCPVADVVAWVTTLAVDGALYYLETGDPTAYPLIDILRHAVVRRLVEE
jgi:streptomycin 6-kinase